MTNTKKIDIESLEKKRYSIIISIRMERNYSSSHRQNHLSRLVCLVISIFLPVLYIFLNTTILRTYQIN